MPISYKGHVDTMLSGVSVAFAQESDVFIADKVFPTYGVEEQTGEFLVYPRGWRMRPQVADRPLGGEPPQATYGTDYDSYRAKEKALAMSLDDRERANASPPHDPEELHVEFLTENHLIHREITWAQKNFAPGIWGRDMTGVTSAPAAGRQTNVVSNEILQWDQALSKPQRAVNELQELSGLTIGKEINLVILGRSLFTILLDHPEIIERTKYTSSEAINKQIIAAYLGVEEVLVPRAVYNVAPELAPQFGDNVDLNWVVNPRSALFLYRNNRVGPKMMTAGLTFIWKGLLGGEGFSLPVYRDRITRAFSDWFAVRTAYDMKIVAQDCGIYIDELMAEPA